MSAHFHPYLCRQCNGRHGDYDAFQRGWAHRMPAASESHKRLTFSFIVPGVISVLSAWVHDDMPDISAEEVIALLESIIENGVNGIYEHISSIAQE